MNRERLFLASCLALIVTAMSFSIRGDIAADFETVFALDKVQLGHILGAAFWGFGLSILVGGPLCDYLGMANIMRMAAVGHIGGAILTILAPNFPVLFIATLIIGIANGLVEAAINPLIATLYPTQKTQKLVTLHAWFPGGIVIGGVLCFLLSKAGLGAGSDYGWQIKMALMLPLAVVYAWMYIGQTFPATERVASGVTTRQMLAEVKRPLFLLLWVCMWFTAATELGANEWIPNIFFDLMQGSAAGILVLCWINGLMWALRQFGGPLAHRLSPVQLIASTAPFAIVGLLLFGPAASRQSITLWFIAAALFAVGVAFWWPSMLGITSERFPRGGAFLLAVIGGTGSISVAVAGPVMGAINKVAGTTLVLPIWAILPLAVLVIFTMLAFYDKGRGGYKVETLAKTEGPMEHPGVEASIPLDKQDKA
jgi:MFS family permease